MKKLIYYSVPLWLLLLVFATYVSYQNSEDDKRTPIKPIKISAKEHGLITISERLPAELSAQGTTVKIKPKKILYPERLPILEIERGRLSEEEISRWFKPDQMIYRGESSGTAYSNELALTFIERTWDIEGPEPGIVILDDRGTLSFNRRLIPTEFNHNLSGADREQIKKDVASYIKTHGGIPSDAFFEDARERPYSNPTKYGHSGSYLTTNYRHSHKGILLMDDVISVQYFGVVDNYVRRWSSLRETGDAAIMSPKRAMEIALKNHGADLGQLKAKLSVDAIWLIYFEPGLRDASAARRQPVYRPGWVMLLNNGAVYLIDAVTGAEYQLPAPPLGYDSLTVVYELY